MLRFAHLEFQVFIGQVLGLSVNSLELTKTHCLLNGVLDVSLGFIVLPLNHVICMWEVHPILIFLNSQIIFVFRQLESSSISNIRQLVK